MPVEHAFVILFAIATAVAIAVSRTRVPYTVALVLVGLAVGSLHVIEPPHLTKGLLFSLFLPGLIFEGAYNMHALELRHSWRSVTALAAPGVIVSIVLAGFGSTWALHAMGLAPDFTWRDGLVFAAIVSATDPIAVVSVFRKLRLDSRLTTLVDAESLFNDGTAIVALTLILAFVSGQSTSLVGLIIQFVVVVVAGAVIGSAIAYAVMRVTKHVDDPMIEIALTTIAAYGSFALAESMHASGVIATVAAGLMLGTTGRETAFAPQTRAAADAFWAYVAFALNSIVFLLIGFEVRPMALARVGAIIAIAFVVLILARVIIVYGTAALVRRTSERLRSGWPALIVWGGLRGALAMVLALALPATIAQRTLLIDMTFGVVVASLLLQGLTIPFAAGRLLRQRHQ